MGALEGDAERDASKQIVMRQSDGVGSHHELQIFAHGIFQYSSAVFPHGNLQIFAIPILSVGAGKGQVADVCICFQDNSDLEA